MATQNTVLGQQLLRVQRGLDLVGALRAKMSDKDGFTRDDLVNLANEITASDQATNVVTRRLDEQAGPRNSCAIEPSLYHDYTGSYVLGTLGYVFTHRNGKLFSRLTGQAEFEVFPEAVDRFYYKAVPAQITFTRDQTGNVCGVTLHQHGYDFEAERVAPDLVTSMEQSLAERVRNNVPFEGSAALLHRLVSECQRGELDYTQMTLPLAREARAQESRIKADLMQMGDFLDARFNGVTGDGWDVYDLDFERGTMDWRFTIAGDGRVSGLLIRPLLYNTA